MSCPGTIKVVKRNKDW